MTYETLKFEIKNQVAHLTLNRPDNANALTMQMGKELLDVAIRCDEDPAIRAVLLTGAGKMFAAGGDLKSFQAMGDDIGRGLKELTIYFHGMISRFSRMDAPVVVAVNGMAAGAGFSLAISGDLVLAAQSAQFVMAYTASGLVPDGSSSYYLPRLIGLRRAQELMLTNRRLNTQEALEWGLITRIVPDADLLTEATALAEKLANGPTRAFGGVKKLLADTYAHTLESQMEMEARWIAEMGRSQDGREGIAAFIEKRKPNFQGG